MKQSAHPTPATRVPLGRRICWGCGGLADNLIMNSLIVLAMPIYNLALGMDPVLLGMALFIPRFADAVFDPIMGNISDNTRSRWGRRRPYIAAGAILCVVMLPLLWRPFFAEGWGQFAFVAVGGLLYSLAYSVFVVPYTALGYELTTDYDERTRVLAWRMYIGLLGSMIVPWIYKLCLHPVFQGDAVTGAQFVSMGLGLIILVTGLLPALTGREDPHAQHQDKIAIWTAIVETMRNKPFLILMGTYVIIICGIFTSNALSLYINIYGVCHGDKNLAATISGLGGTVQAVTSYISLPLLTFIAARIGKRTAMIVGLLLAALGVASLWFTMTPQAPYLQLGSFFISGLGLQGCWLMVSSMVADVCDEDELKTGLRREGVYGAVVGFALKLSLAITALTGGYLLKISGFNAATAEHGNPPDDHVVALMKLLFVGVQCLALLAAAAIFVTYPITRARAEETRRILDQRLRTA